MHLELVSATAVVVFDSVIGGIKATVAEATAPDVADGQDEVVEVDVIVEAAPVPEATEVVDVCGSGTAIGAPSMEAIATEAAATEVRSEAAECWCAGGRCCLTSLAAGCSPPAPEVSASFSLLAELLPVVAAADEDALEGFFFRLRFFARLEAEWW